MGYQLNFEEWVADLRAKKWYLQPEPEADGEARNTYFDLEADASDHEAGSFLVAYEYETNHVFPGLSYQIDDWGRDFTDRGDGEFEEAPWWWEETATPVPRLALGKWLSLHGFSEPVLPDANSREPQEVWVAINGGWMWTPGQLRTTFRTHLAWTIGVKDRALWWLGSILTTRNVGLAIVPAEGRLISYELGSLEVALAQPAEVVDRFSPCKDLRRIGIGRVSYSFSVSGMGASKDGMPDGEYAQIIDSINRPIRSAQQFLESLRSCTGLFEEKLAKPRFFGRKPPQRRRDENEIFEYLQRGAEEHFTKLTEAGYALALIPLGGKTIWVPEGK